jgi:hypothetical protein
LSPDPRALGPDWIDKLLNEIASFNGNNSNKITLGDAWAMLKDRVIQDPTIGTTLWSGLAKTEQDSVLDFFRAQYLDPALTLTSVADAQANRSQLEQALRAGCGVLFKSPQFLLANVTPASYSGALPPPPRLSVCLPGELPNMPQGGLCGYAEICAHWRDALAGMGQAIECPNRSARKASLLVVETDPGGVTGRLAGTGALLPVLVRQVQSSAPIAFPASPAIVVSPAPSPGAVPNAMETSRPAAPAASPRFEPSGPVEIDLIKITQPAAQAPLRGLARIQLRLARLCPGGICGFFGRQASAVARCRDNPADGSCRPLLALCDPRSSSGPVSCGALPADLRESGALAVWAEGAEVKEAAGARILRLDAPRWQRLMRGMRLQAGDLIDMRLRDSLRLQFANVAFGDTAIEQTEVAGITGHMLAITGPSTEKLRARAPKPGALSLDQLIKGTQSGTFNARLITDQEMAGALESGRQADRQRQPSPEAIRAMNSNFQALHRGVPPQPDRQRVR